jgi:hypothetical protein
MVSIAFFSFRWLSSERRTSATRSRRTLTGPRSFPRGVHLTGGYPSGDGCWIAHPYPRPLLVTKPPPKPHEPSERAKRPLSRGELRGPTFELLSKGGHGASSPLATKFPGAPKMTRFQQGGCGGSRERTWRLRPPRDAPRSSAPNPSWGLKTLVRRESFAPEGGHMRASKTCFIRPEPKACLADWTGVTSIVGKCQRPID